MAYDITLENNDKILQENMGKIVTRKIPDQDVLDELANYTITVPGGFTGEARLKLIGFPNANLVIDSDNTVADFELDISTDEKYDIVGLPPNSIRTDVNQCKTF